MKEPRELVYFTDRDLGRQLPEALKAAGLKVETHDDHFGPLTPDDEWLATVGAKGWLAISRDARIRDSPLALRVLMESQAKLFVLVGNLSTSECIDLVIRRRRRIEALAEAHTAAFIAKIRRDGVHLCAGSAQRLNASDISVSSASIFSSRASRAGSAAGEGAVAPSALNVGTAARHPRTKAKTAFMTRPDERVSALD